MNPELRSLWQTAAFAINVYAVCSVERSIRWGGLLQSLEKYVKLIHIFSLLNEIWYHCTFTELY